MSDNLEEKFHVLHVRAHQEFLEALVESETRYRILLDGLNDIVFELDDALYITFLSRAWERQTGRSIAECVGVRFGNFIDHPEQSGFYEAIPGKIQGNTYSAEIRVIYANQERIWFLLTMNAIPSGTGLKWLGTLANIHARKHAETERNRQRHALEAIAYAQANYISSIDFEEVVSGLLTEICAATQSQAVYLECFPDSPSVPQHDPWWQNELAVWRAVVSQTLLYSPEQGEIFVSPGHFPPIPQPGLASHVVCVWSGNRKMAWLLLVHTRPLTREERDIVRPLTSTLGQILWAERQNRARLADQQQLARLSKVASQTSNGVVITDLNGKIQWVNDGFLRMTGYTFDELISKSPGHLLQGTGTDPAVIRQMGKAIEQSESFDVNVVNYRKGGEAYHVRILCNPMVDNDGAVIGFMAIQSDITREKEWAEKLIASNRQKEVLLQEIHHRVKNNLQIVSSLLSMQLDVGNDTLRKPLEDSIHRIQSMALVHQSLYGAVSLERIEFGDYTRNLIRSLVATLAPALRVDVQAEVVEVPIQTSVPLGLIMNELVTNALKYGIFHGDRSQPRRTGDFDIRLDVRAESENILLSISDAGNGLPFAFELARSKTLGLRLIHSLVRQLRARFSYNYQEGSQFIVSCAIRANLNE